MTAGAAASKASFRLLYQAGGSMLVDRSFEARSVDEAFTIAGELLASFHGMPGAHVAFDRRTNWVTVGAGYVSHRGRFAIEPVTAGP